MDSIPSLLGLALRAGRLAVGEEPVGVACRCHKGYLLLLPSSCLVRGRVRQMVFPAWQK